MHTLGSSIMPDFTASRFNDPNQRASTLSPCAGRKARFARADSRNRV
jgi:hypothetical protein